MSVAGKSTLKINGVQQFLKTDPELQESGLVVKEKIIGTTSSHGDIEEFVIGEATSVVLTRQKDTDVAALQALRDTDVLFELADGTKFNMSKAAIIGAMKYNAGTGELTIESIQADEAYYV